MIDFFLYGIPTLIFLVGAGLALGGLSASNNIVVGCGVFVALIGFSLLAFNIREDNFPSGKSPASRQPVPECRVFTLT